MSAQKKEKSIVQEIIGLWPIPAFFYMSLSLAEQIQEGQWPTLTAMWESGFIPAVLAVGHGAVILLFVVLITAPPLLILSDVLRWAYRKITKR